MNSLKVGLLLTVLTALLVWVGSALGGAAGAAIALILAVVMNLGSFWFGDKLVVRMTGARPVTISEAPNLHEMVERIAQRARIPKPAVYVVDDPSPNAFATGRSPQRALVAVNTGLLEVLSPSELEGVVAHEIAHIRSRDTLTMAVVATFAGAIMMLAQMAQIAAIFGGNDEEGGSPLVLILVSLFAPFAAMIVQLGISRAREFEADRLAASYVGTPDGLIGALAKLDRASELVPSRMAPSTAHLCIVNPFKGAGGFLLGLFSTHPPIPIRIEKLRTLGGGRS